MFEAVSEETGRSALQSVKLLRNAATGELTGQAFPKHRIPTLRDLIHAVPPNKKTIDYCVWLGNALRLFIDVLDFAGNAPGRAPKVGGWKIYGHLFRKVSATNSQ